MAARGARERARPGLRGCVHNREFGRLPRSGRSRAPGRSASSAAGTVIGAFVPPSDFEPERSQDPRRPSPGRSRCPGSARSGRAGGRSAAARASRRRRSPRDEACRRRLSRISSAQRRLAHSVTSGSSGRSNRKLDGLKSPSAREVRRTDIESNWAASIRTFGRPGADLGLEPAHHARQPDRTAGVGDDQHLRVQLVDLVVDGRQRLARAGPADDQPMLGQP